MQRLNKKAGARLLNIETYKFNCEQNKLIGEEADDFGANQTNVVVKIHDEKKIYFLEKELKALKKLVNFENSVQYICDFSCMDIKFCNQKNDKLHFIQLSLNCFAT
jgi:hypothetical protein